MPSVIEARGLSKTYSGGRGVHDLNLRIERGEIFGYLGPNGAGKTTTIRLMLDFIRPSRGEILLLGTPPGKSRHLRKRIGYLPGELGLYEDTTGMQSLKFYGAMSGGYTPLREWVCDALQLSATDLKRRIRTYSKGMKQKLGIAQAVQHDPELLILDEPTTGLDPVVQARFFEVLREFRRRGRTVFFSSHVLSEVEHLCDRVGLLRDGKLVLDSRLADLTLQTDRLLYIRLAPAAATEAGEGAPSPPEQATGSPAVAPPEIPGARFFRREGAWLVYAIAPAHVPNLIPFLQQLRPADFRLETALQESFLQLYGVGGPQP